MKGVAELYKEAGKTSFIDDMSAEELAELHSSSELKELVSKLQALLREVEEAEVSYDKRVLMEVCRRRLNKLNRALDLAREPSRLELDANLAKNEVTEGELIEIKYVIENPSGRPASVRIECSASKELEPQSSLTKEVELGAGGRYEGFFTFKALQSGRFEVGPLKAVAKFRDGTKLSKTVGPYEVYIRTLEVKLEASISGPEKVKEGETSMVQIRLVNAGEVSLEVMIEGLDGWEGWRGQLKPREEKVIEANLSLPAGVHTIKPVIKYKDPRGKEGITHVKEIKVEVTKTIAKEAEREVVKTAEEKVSVDIEELVDTGIKHALAAIAGAYIGSKFPEVKKYDKPVLIQDQDLIWTKVKTAEGEEVTAILEHPAVTVIEDKDKYILIRKAKMLETLASTDRKLAKRLQTEFADRAEITLKSWSPPTLEESVHISIKKLDISKEELEELEDELKRAGLELDRRIVDELPCNVLLEVSYKTGKFIRRTKYRVYVLVYSRLRQLYFNEVDHRPMSLAEALEVMRGKVEEGTKGLLVLASPTGWDPQSIEEVRSRAPSNLQLVLIDLKSGDLYAGPGELAANELAALFVGKQLGFSQLSREDENILENLNELLLSGKLSEKEYLKQLENLFKRTEAKQKALEAS